MAARRMRSVVQKRADNLPVSPMQRVVTWDMGPRQLRDIYADRLGELGIVGQDGKVNFALLDAGVRQKANVETGTGGAYNVLFGADTWAQIIQQSNTFGALPKAGWPRSGFRVQSAAAFTSGLGIAEAGAVPAAVIPTYTEISVPPKELAKRTAFSRMFAELQGKDDTITWDEHIKAFQGNFMNAADADIHKDFDTLAGNNMESIDRVAATTSEQAGVGATVGDEDIHGVDKSAQSWWDPNSLHNSGTDRTLSITLINQLLSGQLPYWENGAKGAFYVTGYTTWARWSELEQPLLRYDSASFTFGAEGIRGTDGGLKLPTWDGMPIVKSSHTEVDTIDRIYLLHGEYLQLRFAQPVESVISQDPFVVQFTKALALHAIGELVNLKSKAHGKLRDLK